MLIDLFGLLLFNALLIIGINRSSVYYTDHDGVVLRDSKGVLSGVRQWVEKNLGDFYSKPIITCPPCMASVHSTYVYWTFIVITGFDHYHIPLYIMYIPALSGLTYIINNKIE